MKLKEHYEDVLLLEYKAAEEKYEYMLFCDTVITNINAIVKQWLKDRYE